MTKLPKLLPVVLTAVQLPILLVVPVGQVVTAHRTPERTKAGPGARSRVASRDKTNTFHCSSFILSGLEKPGRSSRQALADSVFKVCAGICRDAAIPLFFF